MSAVISTVLQLLGLIASATRDGSTIAQIIATLTELVPVVVKEAQDLVTPIENIIAALKANPATDAAQMAALQALDLKADAEFEAAATAAEAEDTAADQPPATDSPSIVPPVTNPGSN